MRVVVFVAIFLTVFALLNLYIVKRFINKLHIQDRYKRYFKIFLAINYLGIIGYMVARYNPNIPSTLYFLISLPIGVIFLLFVTAIFYDLFHTLLHKFPVQNPRREFLKKSLDFSALAIATGLSARGIYEARDIVIQEVQVGIKNLQNSYKIVQLSDIHIGGLIDKEFIKNLVARVNKLQSDLVVITGDMVDIALEYAQEALDELKELRSKFGTYFIVGNHEYFHGIEQIIQAVTQRGIKVLENESVYIGNTDDGFNLCGVYDVMGYRVDHHKPDLQKTLQGINPNRPVILLAHQPRFVQELDDRIDLMLSGHTHGGQIYPFRFLVKLQQPYLAGLYEHSTKTQVYVNRGTGFWGPPMRLGASSEITLLELHTL